MFSDEIELEQLAELEHERWSRGAAHGRLAVGPYRQKQDKVRRLHPDLRPYGELPDQTQEYDRVNVRTTQAIWAAEADQNSRD